DAALVAGRDLANVVLEAAQARDLALVDHGVVTQQTRERAAHDLAVDHARARDHAGAADAEGLTHLGAAHRALANRRLEHALERLADLIDGIVDDRVEPHVDAFALGELRGLRLRTDVEAD